MNDPYAELRAALPDATPGLWHQDHGDYVVVGASGGGIAECLWAQRLPNARYIAAANPSVIAALLAERDALVSDYEAVIRERDALADDYDALADDYEAVAREMAKAMDA